MSVALGRIQILEEMMNWESWVPYEDKEYGDQKEGGQDRNMCCSESPIWLLLTEA